MLWLLSRIANWMNRPYDFTDELAQLRDKQRSREHQGDDSGDEDRSPRATARLNISKAVRSAEAAYWAACDAEEKAIRPATLGAPIGLLDEVYEMALEAELLVSDHGLSWDEARKRV